MSEILLTFLLVYVAVAVLFSLIALALYGNGDDDDAVGALFFGWTFPITGPAIIAYALIWPLFRGVWRGLWRLTGGRDG